MDSMKDMQFTDLVRRASIRLQFTDDISALLAEAENLSSEDKFLITIAAKQLSETTINPVDLLDIKVYRGSYVSKEHGHQRVKDSISGEC